jgi:aspartate racemase
MRTIGMIGGMSWESSIEYYRIVNEAVKEKLGGTHSAKSVMVSVDFAEIEALQYAGDWKKATQVMIECAQQVEAGGADFLVICTNTMHKMADDMQNRIGIPILHIADATAEAIRARGQHRIGLLGTRFTMEEDFYRGRLTRKHKLEVLIPEEDDRAVVHRVIYEELVLGIIKPTSRMEYQRIIERLIDTGAEGIVLGCTEIGLLIKDGDCRVPLFDTTLIHALKAAEYALNEE